MTAVANRRGDGAPGLSNRLESVADRLENALERTASDGDAADADADDVVAETAAELQDVVEEAGRLLETVDLESLPAALDLEALPELVDVAGIPTAVRERDPDAALDLHAVRHAIRLRTLWESVDLTEFATAASRLEDEVADVVGEEAMASGGDSEAAGELRRFATEVRPEASNAAIQQQARTAVERGRTGVLAAHAALEDAHGASGGRPGHAGRRRRSRNPTAVSLLPAGPEPDSASTRFSSVPPAVRGAKIDPLPRIYGRRWRTAGRAGSRRP